jgi:hypothetical protein
LREAKEDLVGFALFDNLGQTFEKRPQLKERMWTKCEIENYLCRPDVLRAWSQHAASTHLGGPLFKSEWGEAMDRSIEEIEQAMKTLGSGSPWAPETKVSTDFLDPLFTNFFKRVRLPNLLQKTDYHELARFVPVGEIDPEVREVLDDILETSTRARPQSVDEGTV